MKVLRLRPSFRDWAWMDSAAKGRGRELKERQWSMREERVDRVCLLWTLKV